MQEKLGIIDVGGGYRGVYGAGVLDYCLDNDIKFDVAIGISAGSANLVTYAAGQARRTLKFYTEYGMRKEYASVRNFIFKRSFVDLDYCYGTLSNSGGEYPLDFTAIQNNPMKFIAVATNAITGEAKYFTAEDMAQDNYNIKHTHWNKHSLGLRRCVYSLQRQSGCMHLFALPHTGNSSM